MAQAARPAPEEPRRAEARQERRVLAVWQATPLSAVQPARVRSQVERESPAEPALPAAAQAGSDPAPATLNATT